MTISLRACRLLTRSQRETLDLIRNASIKEAGASAATPPEAGQGSFAHLAGACRAGRIVLNVPPCRYVTSGETLVLAALAALQRPALGAHLSEAPFREPLAACAVDLTSRGILLPLPAMAWTLLVEQGWASGRKRGRTPSVTDRRRAALVEPPQSPKCGSLRHRAVAFAVGRSTVTTAEFGDIGISRQTLSLICAEGLLERTGLGRYRLAAALDAHPLPRGQSGDQVRSTKGMVTSPFTSTGLPFRTIGDQRQ